MVVVATPTGSTTQVTAVEVHQAPGARPRHHSLDDNNRDMIRMRDRHRDRLRSSTRSAGAEGGSFKLRRPEAGGSSSKVHHVISPYGGSARTPPSPGDQVRRAVSLRSPRMERRHLATGEEFSRSLQSLSEWGTLEKRLDRWRREHQTRLRRHDSGLQSDDDAEPKGKVRYNDPGSREEAVKYLQLHGDVSVSSSEEEITAKDIVRQLQYRQLWELRATLEEEEDVWGTPTAEDVANGHSHDHSPVTEAEAVPSSHTTSFDSSTEPGQIDVPLDEALARFTSLEARRKTYKSVLKSRLKRIDAPAGDSQDSLDSSTDASRIDPGTTSFESTTTDSTTTTTTTGDGSASHGSLPRRFTLTMQYPMPHVRGDSGYRSFETNGSGSAASAGSAASGGVQWKQLPFRLSDSSDMSEVLSEQPDDDASSWARTDTLETDAGDEGESLPSSPPPMLQHRSSGGSATSVHLVGHPRRSAFKRCREMVLLLRERQMDPDAELEEGEEEEEDEEDEEEIEEDVILVTAPGEEEEEMREAAQTGEKIISEQQPLLSGGEETTDTRLSDRPVTSRGDSLESGDSRDSSATSAAGTSSSHSTSLPVSKTSILARYFRYSRHNALYASRDYSVDERSDALFREYSRCDPSYDPLGGAVPGAVTGQALAAGAPTGRFHHHHHHHRARRLPHVDRNLTHAHTLPRAASSSPSPYHPITAAASTSRLRLSPQGSGGEDEFSSLLPQGSQQPPLLNTPPQHESPTIKCEEHVVLVEEEEEEESNEDELSTSSAIPVTAQLADKSRSEQV